MNVLGLSRNNRCSMEGISITGRHLSRSSSKFPCFAAAFRFVTGSANDCYNITYKLHIKKALDEVYNNFAIIPKEDMITILHAIQRVVPVKFSFEDSELGDSYFTVKLRLIGSEMQHKALLMFSRTLFEYPHNACAVDALNMKKMGSYKGVNFKNKSLLNLYLISLASFGNFSPDESFINNISPTLHTIPEMKSMFKTSRGPISALSPALPYEAKRASYPRTAEEITDNAKFLQRLEAYIANIKNNSSIY